MLPIRELWKPLQGNMEASVDWWNSLAKDFSEHSEPTADSSLTMRLIEKEGMVTPDCRVLDVGCGAGRFAVALARHGACVQGTDISQKMIGFAEVAAAGLPNVSFSVDDWHKLDLDAKGWRKSFDFVLANMTPAIGCAETFLKLSDASNKWCLLAKPSRRANSVLDALHELVGAPKDTKTLDETIAYAFDLLWQEGFCPKVDYTPEIWHSDKPLEEAVYQYTKRIESYHDLDAGRRAAIRDYLTAHAVNGLVEEITTTTIVTLYWQV